MKILYGIQGTGNGHISRGRMMARHFAEKKVKVDYLFSGRAKDAFFDMEIFGDYQHRRGLTFFSENGRVSYSKTILANNIIRFGADVLALDIDDYDLVITDFEPVTAWASKLRGKEILGVGHQFAFGHNIPRAGNNPVANLTMKMFAPARHSLGLHWNSFGYDILPPVIDTSIERWLDESCSNRKIVVYLPFENQNFVQSMLEHIKGYHFYIYSPELDDADNGHIHLRKTSYRGFKKDLTSATGVISNSGFELISECLYLGLQILTKPQAAQMEQQSNAAALEKLGYATTSHSLTTDTIETWLHTLDRRERVMYPDVAGAIVDWIVDGRKKSINDLCSELWDATTNQSAIRFA